LATRKNAEKKTAEKKAPARKPAIVSRKRKPKVSHEQIAERAYFISIERGGSELENWLLAEHELVGA
jgi:hypothetical protein